MEINNNVMIVIDHRESKTRIPTLLSQKCKTEMKQLTVGDFILSDDVCIERKTVNDFVSSIINKRLFEQLTSMKETYDRPMLIIEGKKSFTGLCHGTKMNPNALAGAIASIGMDYKIPVLHTLDQRDTANLLYVIAKREQEELKKGVSIRQKIGDSMNEKQEFLIAGLPGIEKTNAERLLKHFGTPASVFNATIDDLQKVDGIGKEKAKRIREILDREYERSILE